jgi:hypothetical protein
MKILFTSNFPEKYLGYVATNRKKILKLDYETNKRAIRTNKDIPAHGPRECEDR